MDWTVSVMPSLAAVSRDESSLLMEVGLCLRRRPSDPSRSVSCLRSLVRRESAPRLFMDFATPRGDWLALSWMSVRAPFSKRIWMVEQ